MGTSQHAVQAAAADAILATVDANDASVPKCFYIDGFGGSGKTFLYSALINAFQGQGKTVLPVAWTGIAAILLPGGQTCHTAFRLPLDLQPDTVCRLTMKEKERLLRTDVIIWDEASMADTYALETVDRTIRDVTQIDSVPFSGKVVVLGGDFRQVLPVVPGATPAQIIAKCVKSSGLWRHFHRFGLTVNMRMNAGEVEYAQWLLQLGNATLARLDVTKTEFSVTLPRQCVSQDVMAEFFPNQFDGADVATHGRVIMSPFNEDCRLINERILERLRGEKITYKSIDTVGAVEGEDPAILQQTYPVEFLNSVTFAGLPPHALNLKKNACGYANQEPRSQPRSLQRNSPGCRRHEGEGCEGKNYFRHTQWNRPFHPASHAGVHCHTIVHCRNVPFVALYKIYFASDQTVHNTVRRCSHCTEPAVQTPFIFPTKSTFQPATNSEPRKSAHFPSITQKALSAL